MTNDSHDEVTITIRTKDKDKTWLLLCKNDKHSKTLIVQRRPKKETVQVESKMNQQWRREEDYF